MAARWEVHGTKKGSLPISKEKRKNKLVTIITNVSQNPEGLLLGLKRSIGCGGRFVGNGMIELQGDCQKQVTAYLLDCPKQLKGIAGLRAANAAVQLHKERSLANEEAAKRDMNISSRRADKPRWTRRDKESERQFMEEKSHRQNGNGPARICPDDWIYCSGACVEQAGEPDVPLNDIFDDDFNNTRSKNNIKGVAEEMDEKLLNNALDQLGLLSCARPRTPPAERKRKLKSTNAGTASISRTPLSCINQSSGRTSYASRTSRASNVTSKASTSSASNVSASSNTRYRPRPAGRPGGKGKARGLSGGQKLSRAIGHGYRYDVDDFYDESVEGYSSDDTQSAPAHDSYASIHNSNQPEESQIDPYMARYGDIISDVLESVNQFQWDLFYSTIELGVPEEDAFLVALEDSLNLVNKIENHDVDACSEAHEPYGLKEDYDSDSAPDYQGFWALPSASAKPSASAEASATIGLEQAQFRSSGLSEQEKALVQMGFKPIEAKNALEKCGANIEQAMELLLSGALEWEGESQSEGTHVPMSESDYVVSRTSKGKIEQQQWTAHVHLLTEMGIDYEIALEAIELAQGDIELALQRVLG